MTAGLGDVWSGTTPPGAALRVNTPNAADDVVIGTKTWIFADGQFTADDVGRSFIVANAVTGTNNGHFIIASVTNATTIVSVETPGGTETFGGGNVTCTVYASDQTPTFGNDMEQYAASFHGGLFDFENPHPIVVRQIVLLPGTGTTSWALVLVDADGTEIPIASASSATTYISHPSSSTPGSGLMVLQGQKLKLTSLGGPTTASVCRIGIDQYRFKG